MSRNELIVEAASSLARGGLPRPTNAGLAAIRESYGLTLREARMAFYKALCLYALAFGRQA